MFAPHDPASPTFNFLQILYIHCFVFVFKQSYIFIHHYLLTMHLGRPGSTKDPCLTTKYTQDQTCNLHNKNHHIFINHHTEGIRVN